MNVTKKLRRTVAVTALVGLGTVGLSTVPAFAATGVQGRVVNAISDGAWLDTDPFNYSTNGHWAPPPAHQITNGSHNDWATDTSSGSKTLQAAVMYDIMGPSAIQYSVTVHVKKKQIGGGAEVSCAVLRASDGTPDESVYSCSAGVDQHEPSSAVFTIHDRH